MHLFLHIGLDHVGVDRLQMVLAENRNRLANAGVLVPRGPGPRNHTRLFMAVSDPEHIDPLRASRGYSDPARQDALRRAVAGDLKREIDSARPDAMILTCSQIGTALHRDSERARLHDLLSPLADDIRVIAHVDEPARLLARHYAQQVLEGRARPLTDDLGLTGAADWWDAACAEGPRVDMDKGVFEETQMLPFWLDYTRLVTAWETTFGQGTMTLRPSIATADGPAVSAELARAFNVEAALKPIEPGPPPSPPSAAWIARARQMNAVLLRLLDKTPRRLHRKLWRQLLGELQIPGAPLDPGTLTAVSAHFGASNAALEQRFPALAGLFTPPEPTGPWAEADPGRGYRATQYLTAFLPRIDKATRDIRTAQTARRAPEQAPETLSDTAREILPAGALANFERLRGSPYAPHNRLGAVNEDALAAAFTPAAERTLLPGSTGNVIVGCMKNEAPYILEWIAYHRAVGVDTFLIYTNGCTDGTDKILDRLDAMGIVHHRDNENWKGKSPQQHALNQAMKDPVLRKANWIIHIDVDEFMNIRCGNGTLDDVFAAVPDATNVAMTWRLFGHNGITRLEDKLVIDQFDHAAPKFCPKPHTVWGFKTMFRNIGAYKKLSCHRPNQLKTGYRDRIKWVNGSGRDMTQEVADNGWRNSKRTIGYDLVQLNHYALRSAESYLIKRQRGRALHVDRSIGLNYWIRMDWSDHRDITIKRNLPRMRAEHDRLLSDPTLRALHDTGFAWHRAKADELHQMPEFEALYQQALRLKLSGTERVAYALTLDMDS